jgi:hypothetical protein
VDQPSAGAARSSLGVVSRLKSGVKRLSIHCHSEAAGAAPVALVIAQIKRRGGGRRRTPHVLCRVGRRSSLDASTGGPSPRFAPPGRRRLQDDSEVELSASMLYHDFNADRTLGRLRDRNIDVTRSREDAKSVERAHSKTRQKQKIEGLPSRIRSGRIASLLRTFARCVRSY